MGKPIGDRAMTAAERQRKHRLERRVRKETVAQYDRYSQAAKLAWIEDHPGHGVVDFKRWSSCGATPEQGKHWYDWDAVFHEQYHTVEPAAVERGLSASEWFDRRAALEAVIRKRKLTATAPPVGQGAESQALVAAWKEIDALRREIDRLEAKLAERNRKLPGHKEILPISHPVAEVNAFHGELVGFVADFSERFAAWRKSGSPLDDEGKAALMQALYLCGDGFMRVAQELDGR